LSSISQSWLLGGLAQSGYTQTISDGYRRYVAKKRTNCVLWRGAAAEQKFHRDGAECGSAREQAYWLGLLDAITVTGVSRQASANSRFKLSTFGGSLKAMYG
jgi:hypothetical protein